MEKIRLLSGFLLLFRRSLLGFLGAFGGGASRVAVDSGDFALHVFSLALGGVGLGGRLDLGVALLGQMLVAKEQLAALLKRLDGQRRGALTALETALVPDVTSILD